MPDYIWLKGVESDRIKEISNGGIMVKVPLGGARGGYANIFVESRDVYQSRYDESAKDVFLRKNTYSASYLPSSFRGIATGGDYIKREVTAEEIRLRDQEAKRYGKIRDFDEMVDSEDYQVRIKAAGLGYGLDKLINDQSPSVRRVVASQGYGICKLESDPSWKVRTEVMKKGDDSGKFVSDTDPRVRVEVAKNFNECVEKDMVARILANDEDPRVRAEIVGQEDFLYYYHDYGAFEKDVDETVRSAVAKQGYWLHILANDESEMVRSSVKEYLENANMTLDEWKTNTMSNPYLASRMGLGLEELASHEEGSVRSVVARKGYGLSKLINDEKGYVREEVAKQGYGLDTLINDKDFNVRKEVAMQGYGLDTLVSDINWDVRRVVASMGFGLSTLVHDATSLVRATVANQGYGLDRLVSDESYGVRAAVARKGYRLDILVDDESYEVRKEVARQGYGLGVLVFDENEHVRCQVANHGYGLDVLTKDESEWVKANAWNYLEHNGLTLEEWKEQNPDKLADASPSQSELDGENEEIDR